MPPTVLFTGAHGPAMHAPLAATDVHGTCPMPCPCNTSTFLRCQSLTQVHGPAGHLGAFSNGNPSLCSAPPLALPCVIDLGVPRTLYVCDAFSGAPAEACVFDSNGHPWRRARDGFLVQPPFFCGPRGSLHQCRHFVRANDCASSLLLSHDPTECKQLCTLSD